MDRLSFDIYIPDGKKFHLTPDWTVFGLWFIAIGFSWAIDGVLPNSGDYRGYIALIVGLVTAYYLIASFFTYKPLNGRLEGELIFNNDDLTINGATYPIEDIYNLNFFFEDYYGKSTGTGRSFGPRRYQGVNNYISFTDKNNEDHIIYFQLKTEHSYLSLAPFINRAIKLNRMTVNSGIELLGIENVSIN
ncbi:MAG TPA: hypothetical protein VHE59_03735 [Mucilaginibacter sp.]|nr:hypothetical protein [Mucilaginibacter sp.]